MTKTPYYLYSMGLLRETIEAARNAASVDDRFRVHYAMKANTEKKILEAMRDAGFGVDTVSGGEIKLALDCGFDASKIVFAGVGKSDEEIDLGILAGIGCFNAESTEEIEVISQRAALLGKRARVALRVNPEIDAHTHHYITTGLAENKFGIPMVSLERAIEMVQSDDHLELHGLHFHIGSQITTMKPYEILCERINALQEEYAQRGVTFPTINVGGGLGVDYDNPSANPIPDFREYFNTFSRGLQTVEGQEIHFELGRSLVAQCGSLITKVLYVKKGFDKKFVIVDAGFTDLIRPALYGAHHLIENLTSQSDESERYDVVGPVCESSDVFAEDVILPLTQRGDLLALRTAGAYGAVMAMQYNCRQLPGTVFE